MNTTTLHTPYIPPNAQRLSEIDIPQIRLALQGASGTGKTYSALTSTNIIVADFDNNLTAHTHRKDIHRIPFCDTEWLRKTYSKIANNSIVYPARDCFKEWLKTEGIKLAAGQILFLDSWTTLQAQFDLQTTLEPVLTRTGSVDDFAFWGRKQDYAEEILNLFKSLKCHIIVSFHEQTNRDSSGNLLDKILPMMQGKFVNKLGLYFTDWFRCIAESRIDAADKKKIIGTDYFWQTKSTSEVNLKSRLDLPMKVEPNFDKLVSLYFPAVSKTT